MSVIAFVALIFAANLKESDEARILGLCPLPGTSQMIACSALLQELASRGHDLTVITPFQPEKPIANYTVVPVKKITVNDLMKRATGDANAEVNKNLFDLRIRANLINSNEKFDVIILQAFFFDCFLGFAHKFKAPVVQFSVFGGTAELGNLVGNPSPYSYVPDSLQELSDKMTFTERLLNTIGHLFQKLTTKYFHKDQDKLMRKHFHDPNMPSIEELEKRTALVLVNHHFSISYPRPMVPNFVQVGGLHVKPPKKLPADLQKYMDDAPEGVIYFSMGSNLQSADMPEETVKAFTGAFSKLKQKVIWKWETDSLPGQPANLKLGKWLPQSDILAHPNVRLFITHGGLLSTQETVHRGVPVVGIPIFGDQRLNMKKTESLGFGKLLEFRDITENSLLSSIKEVLENPKYRENAQRLSRIFRDQPMTPMEQAVFWTEYVIRHKGAPHMRSAALDLTWYQYFLLDVIAVLVLAAGLRWLVTVFLLLTKNQLSESAKILAIFPFQSRSHMIMGSALMKELANRGHQVTMISHFPEKEKIANYTDIQIKTTMVDVLGSKGSADRHFEEDDTGVIEKIRMTLDFLYRVNVITCDMMLEEESVKRLIRDSDAKFDLVVIEAFFNECFLGFVHKFNAPLIQVCTFGGMYWLDDWFGNPHAFSYVPFIFSPFTDKMVFGERLFNAVAGTMMNIGRNYVYLPRQDAVMKKHFGFLENLPSLSELECNTSLLLINHHFSISYPRPLMPNMVQVGGLHVKNPKKLPQDLQKYIDDAPDGVIYFSMGSNLKSADMPEETVKAFTGAFSKLKQKVIWKWETDSLPGQPANLKLGKWLPQSDILAHPNVRLFITHGGLLSTQETIHRGVPVVGIPIFGDQRLNMKKTESLGFGKLLEYKNITEYTILSSIKEVLENPKYRENAQRLSRIFRDQPMTPMEQAVFWTEYVIRHKGAPHMRSAALDLTWYQYFLLDVIAVLVLAVVAVLTILFIIIRTIFKLICRRSKPNVQITSRKKKN
ncbi:hypothetical protein L9F63_000305 [Diploptera punctata]|uniref:UDP-glycosyltransferases domain-containing protein n=1 Tax=Diploptera punctata TaxID=6984 RepID=A0AAD8ANL3_DIPPU|nr:hypothetical protein L9F63_000305 [Diploptera punctata]